MVSGAKTVSLFRPLTSKKRSINTCHNPGSDNSHKLCLQYIFMHRLLSFLSVLHSWDFETSSVEKLARRCACLIISMFMFSGEEALTMYLAKNKLDRKLANATQNVEALHQLASSYFIDRDGTMRKLHEIQISTNAIKVGERAHY